MFLENMQVTGLKELQGLTEERKGRIETTGKKTWTLPKHALLPWLKKIKTQKKKTKRGLFDHNLRYSTLVWKAREAGLTVIWAAWYKVITHWQREGSDEAAFRVSSPVRTGRGRGQQQQSREKIMSRGQASDRRTKADGRRRGENPVCSWACGSQVFSRPRLAS